MLVLAHPSRFKSMVWHHASILGDAGKPIGASVLEYLADGWMMDGPREVFRMNNGRMAQVQCLRRLSHPAS